jgi:hypothetical protein
MLTQKPTRCHQQQDESRSSSLAGLARVKKTNRGEQAEVHKNLIVHSHDRPTTPVGHSSAAQGVTVQRLGRGRNNKEKHIPSIASYWQLVDETSGDSLTGVLRWEQRQSQGDRVTNTPMQLTALA